ncbi:unnamed protein product [Symbiodinium sp. CCMP2592]|nr:unnamed protein product [Symbiodinium sp. CCMP2592]
MRRSGGFLAGNVCVARCCTSSTEDGLSSLRQAAASQVEPRLGGHWCDPKQDALAAQSTARVLGRSSYRGYDACHENLTCRIALLRASCVSSEIPAVDVAPRMGCEAWEFREDTPSRTPSLYGIRAKAPQVRAVFPDEVKKRVARSI